MGYNGTTEAQRRYSFNSTHQPSHINITLLQLKYKLFVCYTDVHKPTQGNTTRYRREPELHSSAPYKTLYSSAHNNILHWRTLQHFTTPQQPWAHLGSHDTLQHITTPQQSAAHYSSLGTPQQPQHTASAMGTLGQPRAHYSSPEQTTAGRTRCGAAGQRGAAWQRWCCRRRLLVAWARPL